jgi:putative ABC transport system permease protein
VLDSLLQDLRYALRVSRRAPGLTVVAVLALAIGIGANTAIFTIVNAVLLGHLPFRQPDRIVVLWEEFARRPGQKNVLGPSQFVRWRERATAFERMAALADTRSNLTGAGEPEELIVQNVTADFFPILGVSAALGRTLDDAEYADPESQSVVMSSELWQRRFGSDPAVLGRTIQLNGRPRIVIGVMPPGFRLFIKSRSLTGRPSDLWAPWVLPADARTASGRFLEAIALLKPGVTVAEAQTQLTTIAAQLVVETPERNTGWGAQVVPLHDELSGEYRSALLMLAGAVGFVLLIACANVANLLLARGAAREREIAVRTALGAGRRRVLRQLLTEAVVLAALGGALGLLLAYWGVSILAALSPVELATSTPFGLNHTVLAFTAIVSIATAIVCGIVPAFEGSRSHAQDALRDGARQVGTGRRGRRLRQIFVVSEIALAVVLLVGAGLMLHSFGAMMRVDPGFSTANVLTMRLQLPIVKYADDAQRVRFFRDVETRIRALPGVQAAGAISFLPLTGLLGAGTGFVVEGRPAPPPGAITTGGGGTSVSVCDNGFFESMRLPLIKGRLFTDREMVERSNVVVISESLARRFFPGENPIGHRLSIDMTSPIVPTEIIGVVGDVHFRELTSEPQPTSYWPHPQLAYSAMTLTIRATGDPSPLAPAVERAIRALDPEQPVSDVKTMTQWAAQSVAQARFSSLLLAAFAAVALLLAAIGIYGVMTYAVSQRTSEIGIRLALGADGRQVVGMILRETAWLAGIGLAAGLGASVALGRTVQALLYSTSPTDLRTLAAVAGVLGSVAFAAGYVPARRASKIAPLEALRAS